MENNIQLDFLSLYKLNIEYLRKYQNGNNFYNIYVESKILSMEQREVIINLVNIKDKSANAISLPTITLNHPEAIKLIDLIRTDFITNHDIKFASYSPREQIQALNNDMFSLRIDTPSFEEMDKAAEINDMLNNKEKAIIKILQDK